MLSKPNLKKYLSYSECVATLQTVLYTGLQLTFGKFSLGF